jgi:hypothetical protein
MDSPSCPGCVPLTCFLLDGFWNSELPEAPYCCLNGTQSTRTELHEARLTLALS